jgi:hypothetical protein
MQPQQSFVALDYKLYDQNNFIENHKRKLWRKVCNQEQQRIVVVALVSKFMQLF